MSRSFLTYQRIVDYLKDLLSGRQRHELEKEVMRDAFEEDAFDGLGMLTGEELDADMQLLQNRLENRMKVFKKRSLVIYYRMAASVAIVVGLGITAYFMLHPGPEPVAPKPIAQENMPLQTTEKNKDESAVLNRPVASDQATPGKTEAHPPVSAMKESDVSTTDTQAETGIPAEKYEEPVSRARAVAREVKTETFKLERIPTAAAPVAAEEKRTYRTAQALPLPVKLFNSRVVDDHRQPLTGVTIMEKGTQNGVVTDADGRFSLKLHDTTSTIALNYVGFKEIEFPAGKEPDKEIVMQEDLLTLYEVVVVGYGTQKKSDATGAVSKVIISDEPNLPTEAQIVFTRPIPPGESLRSFKKSVESRLNMTRFKEIPGKYKIRVTFTVHQDGIVDHIRIIDGIPVTVADEYKRCIAESPPWQPATESGVPIDAEIEMRFNLSVE
jgi:hypothetical protein